MSKRYFAYSLVAAAGLATALLWPIVLPAEEPAAEQSGTPKAAQPAEVWNQAQGLQVDPSASSSSFTESTNVIGKVDVAPIKGVWLMVATAELAPGKFKSFPQLFKITTDANGAPQFHLLDVDLPKPMQAELDKVNNETLAGWVPTAAQRKELAQQWQKLPPGTVGTKGYLYGKLQYVVIAPDQYPQAFPKLNPVIKQTMEGSKFTVDITEDYKPIPVAPGHNVAQLIRRKTIYSAKSVDKDLIKGDQSLGFVAAGPGVPLPIQLKGAFAMYRIAAAS